MIRRKRIKNKIKIRIRIRLRTRKNNNSNNDKNAKNNNKNNNEKKNNNIYINMSYYKIPISNKSISLIRQRNQFAPLARSRYLSGALCPNLHPSL